MRSLCIGLLMFALAFSGCTETEETDGGGTGSDVPQTMLPGRYVPWTLADHWTFDMEVRGFERFASTRLVYFQESGPEYVVGTPARDEAVYHAVFSFNPILGRIHQGHLSPHEGGAHATMFPWRDDKDHIRDGQTWQTNFYGHLLTLTASENDKVPMPGGKTATGFLIAGKDPNSAFAVSYSYVADVKWFTFLRVVDAEGLFFELTLKEKGTGYKGAAYFIRASDLYNGGKSSDDGIAIPLTETFTVSQDLVDKDRVEAFAVSAAIDARLGSAEVRLLDPDGKQVYRKTFEEVRTSGETQIDEVFPDGKPSTKQLGERPNWKAGTYTVEYRFTGDASATLRIVGTQDNSGNV